LYLAEEVSSIGGQKVTTFRAVTLGKLLRLVGILAIGWFLLKFLAGSVRRLVARRPNVTPATAEAAGNWTFGIGIALLVIVALNRVHIPFTAFAVLGGTLAIGIGFGAQTLLKNFISGIILSLERPFEVGDVVEVEGIIGRIEKIGMRASAIKHFDGKDTLLPNSQLLENRVSNWTHGNTPIRGSITVGVAYDSSLRDVSRILLAVAKDHGLVLDHPEPEVRFEEFGDNALGFRLLFWLDPSRSAQDPLASDLRFMASRALQEAGIVIAFPQRDLHFDEDRPLKIELSRSDRPRKPKLP
jgi:small-conductance mechanosensitive channel